MKRKSADDNSIPLALWPDANRLAVDPVEYDDSIQKYEAKAHVQLRNSDTVVVSGYGVQLKVEYDSLVLEYERGHIQGRKKLLRLDRGVHKTKNIFVSSQGGYVSFEAMEWCVQQGITVFLLNWKNDVVQVLTPRQSRNARIVHLQYVASQSKRGVEIVREIIRQKTEQQITALKCLPSHPLVPGSVLFVDGRRAIIKKHGQTEYSEPVVEQFERGLQRLQSLRDIDSIRTLEAQLALAYWRVFVGIPIGWNQSDRKRVPQHWTRIPERVSGISSTGKASQATNPFHAVLNFAYAVLKAQVLQSVLIHGLDETIGFLHVPHEGNQSFVYDIMEPFRSPVDTKVLDLFSRTVFKSGDFVQSINGECQLNEGLRHYVITTCRIPNLDIDLFVEHVLEMISDM